MSSTNLAQVSDILKMLENQVKKNQKSHMEMVEKIGSLYERLRLDMAEKYQFLSLHQVGNHLFINNTVVLISSFAGSW